MRSQRPKLVVVLVLVAVVAVLVVVVVPSGLLSTRRLAMIGPMTAYSHRPATDGTRSHNIETLDCWIYPTQRVVISEFIVSRVCLK